jgi:hypothetical protein
MESLQIRDAICLMVVVAVGSLIPAVGWHQYQINTIYLNRITIHSYPFTSIHPVLHSLRKSPRFCPLPTLEPAHWQRPYISARPYAATRQALMAMTGAHCAFDGFVACAFPNSATSRAFLDLRPLLVLDLLFAPASCEARSDPEQPQILLSQGIVGPKLTLDYLLQQPHQSRVFFSHLHPFQLIFS